jgi:hypothetical protein
MANSPFIVGGAASLVGRVQNPKATQLGDSSPSELSLSRLGSVHTDSVRGQYGSMAHRAGTFMAAYSTAAATIGVNTTTSSSTFVVVNPTGSGVYMEPIMFQLDFLLTNAAPSTATVVGFNFVPLATNAISAVTKIPVPLGLTAGGYNLNIGGAAPVGYVATVATFASAQTIAANWGYPMFTFPASWVPTVGGYPVPLTHEFLGRLILPPGYAMPLVASTAFAANTCIPSMSWAEYLI